MSIDVTAVAIARTDLEREAERQRALLDASLYGQLDPLGRLTQQAGARLARGAAAYRANLDAAAERALAAGFPVLQQVIGAEAFAPMARDYLRALPPSRGDLAWLGARLPDFLAGHAALADEPYLADLARLEWAVSRAEVAADADFDAASLARLGEQDPADLWLQLRPGTACISSQWPVASIWLAHRSNASDGVDEDRFAAVRAAFAAGVGEHVLAWRRGWRVEVGTLDAAEAAITAAVIAGCSLQDALDRTVPVAGNPEGFDFAAWLQRALAEGWLWRVTTEALPISTETSTETSPETSTETAS